MVTFREICEMLSPDTLNEMINDLSGKRGIAQHEILIFLKTLIGKQKCYKTRINKLHAEKFKEAVDRLRTIAAGNDRLIKEVDSVELQFFQKMRWD